MEYNRKVKVLSRGHNSCDSCGCIEKNCICNKLLKGELQDEIVLLTHGREIIRPSNTGRIIKKSFQNSCSVIVWQRNSVDKRLSDMLNKYKGRTYIVFPNEDSIALKNIKKDFSMERRLFIIIDGTWKEAKKIINKSHYLKHPFVKLPVNISSGYNLRKNKEEGGVSTIEAVIAILENSRDNNSMILKTNFQIFLEAFNRSILGQ